MAAYTVLMGRAVLWELNSVDERVNKLVVVKMFKKKYAVT
jgi:hypothetical protein